MTPLPCKDPELRDLAAGEPELLDSRSGQSTGSRLVRLLGVGGMSSVFLAKVDLQHRTQGAPRYPERMAVKIIKPAVAVDLAQEGIDARKLAEREATVLHRLMAHRPPTDAIVAFHGQGDVLIEVNGRGIELPWLALELVDGGPDGTSLAQRVARAPGGCDPVRVHRLTRRISEGVSILHAEGVIHRDLKPDNVLVTGPLGDEVPKIADCGIARYEGALSTLPAFTREYAAPEQWLSRPGRSNPLIGPWTDVHALAAVIWFLVAGESWCRGPGDRDFLVNGARRSLREGLRLHPGFAGERAALDALDVVLARGASPILPEHVHATAPSLAPKNRPWRYASVDELMEAVLPVLDDIERKWRARAAREGLASTILRTAHTEEAMTVEPLAELVTLPPLPFEGDAPSPLAPGNVAFQADGRALLCFADRLYHLWEEQSTPVPLAPEHAALLAETKRVVRLPFGGFALVGPRHIRVVRPGRVMSVPLPSRPDGKAVGPIVAAFGDAYAFGVVTADAGEGGPELWLFGAGSLWGDPTALPGLGEVNAVASTPYGFLVVGEAQAGPRAYAVMASEFGHVSIFMRGLREQPPLRAALASAERMAWAANDKGVLALDHGNVVAEETATLGPPVAMGLDPLGLPWLLTASAVMRRSTHGEAPAWRLFHQQEPGDPPLVGIGFTAGGVRLVDARGGGALLRPLDVDAWQSK
jgi:eukaryotic-like serine/threonine-protein kinase